MVIGDNRRGETKLHNASINMPVLFLWIARTEDPATTRCGVHAPKVESFENGGWEILSPDIVARPERLSPRVFGQSSQTNLTPLQRGPLVRMNALKILRAKKLQRAFAAAGEIACR